MKILTLDEFINYYYTYKRLPNGIYSNNKKILTQIQLQSKFEKYLKSIEKAGNRQESYRLKKFEKNQKIIEGNFESLIDEKWVEVQEFVKKRANNKCEITPLLTKKEKDFVYSQAFGDLKILDCIHVISRSASKKLYYDPVNIIYGLRFIHKFVDEYRNPFTLKPITNVERNNLFIRFIGIRRWNYLQDNK
jgi:hypothetical protein